MELRFWIDPETNLPHIFDHGVTEEEVRQVLRLNWLCGARIAFLSHSLCHCVDHVDDS